VLRHQLIVLRRGLHGRVRLTDHDRWFFIQLYRWCPSILRVLTIFRPETLVRWHRAGFRLYEAPRVKRLFRDQTFLTSFLPFKRLTRAQVCIDGTDGPLAWPRWAVNPRSPEGRAGRREGL